MEVLWCFTVLTVHAVLVLPSSALDGEPTLQVDNDLVLKLLQRVDHLETKDRDQASEIAALRVTIKRQEDRIAELENRENQRDIQGESNEIDFTLDESNGTPLKAIRGKTTNTHYDVTHSDREGNETLKHRNSKGQRLRQRRQEDLQNVAFYAVVDTHHLTNLGANQRIEFDRVVTNIGQSYHPHLGVFICPVGGTYVFSTSLMGVNHDNSHFYISLNGNAVANMYIHSQDSYLITTSRTVVLSLNKGDEVSVRNMNVTEGVFGYQFSSFSGFYLFHGTRDDVIVG